MPDSTDHSQEREAQVTAEAMRQRAESAPAGESALECAEPIPDDRRAAIPGCQVCIDCAERLEREARVYGQ
ncbi:transcriptional regulator, TraR/DksA family [Thiohalospira halophila DSM 15071]|uniref:Transcriptional regulator, TraR/DksA family n=1 Tax=Thiohalospira halophila DSM 15071 TaxID=1123397 RepID=A0A1I1U9K1_9GAMM|nr:TraR/DksA C4-type zinc finger protein [Thiohalospira halophila]SFD67437.1 transcriptional regulator, TraR/DksA family [Thiohalospira halophila DSM 15071]